jgi:hypothetical protein
MEFAGDLERGVLQNNHHFYKWYSELTVLRRQQIEGEYGEYLSTLSQRLDVATSISARVDHSLNVLSELNNHHHSVSAKVRPAHPCIHAHSKSRLIGITDVLGETFSMLQIAQIRKSCERLMHEKEMLVQYANALTARLGCFDELEALGREFHKLSTSSDEAAVMPLLARLDGCLNYLCSNPQYMDTMSYTLRLRQLQVLHIYRLLAIRCR